MNNLKEKLKEAGLTQKDVAKELGVSSLSTVNLKLNDKAIITTREANILKKIINEKTGKNYSLEDLFPLQ